MKRHSTQSEYHVEFLNVKTWRYVKKPLGFKRLIFHLCLISVVCIKMAFVWLQKSFWPLEHIIIATWQVMRNQFPLLYDVSPYGQYSQKELASKQQDCSAEHIMPVTSTHAVLSSNIALGVTTKVRTCRQ